MFVSLSCKIEIHTKRTGMIKKITSLALVGLFVVALSAPVSALAQEGEIRDVSNLSASDADQSSSSDDSTEPSGENKLKTGNVERRLKDTKLKICRQRQSKISGIISRNVVRPEKQLALFNSISQRVQHFYNKQGNISVTYEEKLAAVNSAKATAEAYVKVLVGLGRFNCTSADPKGNAVAFKLALDKANDSLKAYRQAVKDLIQDVKTAQGVL